MAIRVSRPHFDQGASGSTQSVMSASALSAVRMRGSPAALPALAAIFLLSAEADSAWRVLRSPPPLTARPARFEVLAFATVTVIVAGVALWPRRRARWLALSGPALVAAGVLGATAVLGGQAVAMLAAVLSMAALWYVGERLLRAVGARRLAQHAVVSWLAGIAPLCLATLLLGRISLFKWWTIGILIVILGALGTARAVEELWARRSVIGAEVAGTSLASASAGVILLMFAVAAIYTAAPEIQFDALYAKAYLPVLWAKTGTIGPINGHVQLNVTGWFELVASWGNLFGAPATGRYLQLCGFIAVPAVVWSWGRRFGSIGPLAAVAVAVTPTLFWQATTADDDLLLALATFGLAVAVFEALQPANAATERVTGLAIGLLAGTGVSLKSHLIPIFLALLLAWVLAGRRWDRIRPRLTYGLIGALITAAPPLALRWIDTGNPVFPAYNNIFRSPYWLPINETFNFPFWAHPGLLGPARAIWDAIFTPLVMQEAAPPGAFGALVGIVVAAVLTGWIYRRRVPGLFALWLGIVVAVVAWWVEFRYLRYLLPAAFASIVLLLAAWRPGQLRPAIGRAAVIGVAAASAASFVVAVAQFWNVPNGRVPVSAALGRWNASDYLDAAFLERGSILAFNRLAPSHAVMVTDAFERNWLTGSRDLDALWELSALMQLRGPLPRSGDAAFTRMQEMGVRWALVTGPDRDLAGTQWLPEVLATHGQPRFSARGWDLYQLVDHPRPPSPVAACDRVGAGISGCWTGARTPEGYAAAPITRTVSVCPAQLVGVYVRQRSGGAPSTVMIQLAGAPARDAAVSGQTVPGARQPTYVTVPIDSHQAQITVAPGAGAIVTNASVERFGRPCAN